MCGQSIRLRLTTDLADAQDDREQERYDQLYAELEDEARAEHMLSFGSEYSTIHPFKASGNAIHERVLKILRQK